MKEIKELNPETLGYIRLMLNAALEQGTEHLKAKGLKIELTKCRYRKTRATFQLRITVEGLDDGPSEHVKLIMHRFNLGTSETDNYKLVDYNDRARKQPFIITDKRSGQQYKATHSYAMELFKAPNAYTHNDLGDDLDMNGGRDLDLD